MQAVPSVRLQLAGTTWPQAAKLWAAGGEEEAVVRWLREGARGGGERGQQEVRGLWPQVANLWATGGGEEALVRWLREGTRWVGELLAAKKSTRISV